VAEDSPAYDPSKDPDDWFDIDKYRQAAGVAYEFSKKKMESAGEQERETRKQQQEFGESDEARDYNQAQRAYKF
jgi:hypothetical protein